MKNCINKKYLFILFLTFLFLGSVHSVDAATMRLLSNIHDVSTGQEFTINVVVDTEGQYINAAEAKITFRNDVLELLSVNKTISSFNFWLKEPFISNEEGFVEFIGGTPKGISGEALQILKMRFLVKGAGESHISILGAVVSASDGKGTNVLTDVENLKVVNNIESKVLGESNGIQYLVPVELPKKVVREPVSIKDLPQKPNLNVSFYPDQSTWYKHLGHTAVFWDLPNDVIKIAANIDHSPNTEPQDVADNLTDGKDFEIPEDGIWYIHVQFKNNVGWGETTHYKILADSAPPLPFEIEMAFVATDNPTPRINYHSHDWLSGMAYAEIFIDDELVFVDEGEVKPGHLESGVNTEPLPPGEHTATVRLFDKAGNGVEDKITFEILSIESPTIIQPISSLLDFDGDELVWGHALPNVDVKLRFTAKDGDEIFAKTTDSSSDGHWMVDLDHALPKGKYTMDAIAIDGRGAQSYPSKGIDVRSGLNKISFGFIELSILEVILGTLLIVVLGLGLMSRKQKKRFSNSL